MNPTTISRCNYCGQHFCTECTDAKTRLEYCSLQCEEDEAVDDCVAEDSDI